MHILVDVRILLIFLYSLDHFASVFAPFMYPRHSLKLTVINSVLAWLVVIVGNVLGIPQILDCYKFSNAVFDLCTEHILQHRLQGFPINILFCNTLSSHAALLFWIHCGYVYQRKEDSSERFCDDGHCYEPIVLQ